MPIVFEGGAARDSRGGRVIKNGGRVARGEFARDDGLEHSRRVEEAQEEGVDPKEETQHGDWPLCSRADAEVSAGRVPHTRPLFPAVERSKSL